MGDSASDGVSNTRATKKDIAWKWTKQIDGERYFRCRFCDHKISGTINRLKHHLAGTNKNISKCLKCPDDVKQQCLSATTKLASDKAKQRELLEEIRSAADGGFSESISSQRTSNDVVSGGASGNFQSPQPRPRGPMDKFTNSVAKQATLNSQWKKDERKEVCRKIGRFIFSKALPFNVVNDPYWLPMVESIANFGPGFKPPSMHELRTWVLDQEVKDINLMFKEHKEAWKEFGCSIMSDGWSDGKSRCLINFLVNSPAGTWFLKSIDASDSVKNGELLFNYLDEVVEQVGEENVVQIITDNASNYMNAGKRLMEKRGKLYWTPCAAHCIDLMLEDIAKLKVFEQTIGKAKQVVKFIYGHAWVLSTMREFTKNHEIVRPAVTRFATAFLTLQSLYKQKQALISMFSSEKWNKSPWAKKVEGAKAQGTVLYDPEFWRHLVFCIKSTLPLVCVLREVDSEERPAMGFIYELMDSAKEKIAFNCGGNEKKYKPIWRKIDARWTPQLHQPLHAAGYYLNPQLRYEPKFSNDHEVRQGLFECMDRMLSYEDRVKADVQLDQYDRRRGEFGSQVAMDTRKKRSPADWWLRFGSMTPELTRFAVRVLSLTCSASGCERNWSTFQSIHTKKRNKLEHKKLNALAYVMYNTRLRERSIKRRQENIDPIVVNEVPSDDEWIAEKEDPALPRDTSWLDEPELFNVDAICTLPQATYVAESSSLSGNKRPIVECSSQDKGKGKARVEEEPIVEVNDDEDDEIEEIEGYRGGYGTNIRVDMIDEDDDIDGLDI